jgi:hypothetical protein
VRLHGPDRHQRWLGRYLNLDHVGRVKRWLVGVLEDPLCRWSHPITTRRPWLWLFSNCPFAALSSRLDERWHTGVWTIPTPTEEP